MPNIQVFLRISDNAVFFGMLTNTAVGAQGTESVLVKATEPEWMRITGDAFSSGWENETGTISDSEGKGSSRRKTSYQNHI